MTPPTLLLVDGTNVVMRCAWGGDVPAERAVPIALGMLERAVREFGATHCIVAFDSATSWRRELFDGYKANRAGRDTASFASAFRLQLEVDGYCCVDADGFEADDILATLAARVARIPVVILSGDSDLLSCADDHVRVAQPAGQGTFRVLGPSEVCEKYGIPAVSALPAYKALVGEPGDGIPGVHQIGPKRASSLLQQHLTLNAILVAGGGAGTAYDAATGRVAAHADQVRLAYRLATLRRDVPLAIVPADRCRVPSAPPVERPRPQATFTVPAATRAAQCRSCGAEVFWITTDAGRQMPVDVNVEGGRTPGVDADGRGISHFATCPFADEHRRPRLSSATPREAAAVGGGA